MYVNSIYHSVATEFKNSERLAMLDGIKNAIHYIICYRWTSLVVTVGLTGTLSISSARVVVGSNCAPIFTCTTIKPFARYIFLSASPVGLFPRCLWPASPHLFFSWNFTVEFSDGYRLNNLYKHNLGDYLFAF